MYRWFMYRWIKIGTSLVAQAEAASGKFYVAQTGGAS
jgi:hypothetical protein